MLSDRSAARRYPLAQRGPLLDMRQQHSARRFAGITLGLRRCPIVDRCRELGATNELCPGGRQVDQGEIAGGKRVAMSLVATDPPHLRLEKRSGLSTNGQPNSLPRSAPLSTTQERCDSEPKRHSEFPLRAEQARRHLKSTRARQDPSGEGDEERNLLRPRNYDPSTPLLRPSEQTLSSRAHDRPRRQRGWKEPAQPRINGDRKLVFKTSTAV
jgi:hypothetical protein